jgi:single-stranded DNA-binding protein
VDRVSIAVNNRIKKSDAWGGDLCFIDVSMFGKSTEPIGEALDKGMTVQLEGRLQFQSWQGKDDRATARMKSLPTSSTRSSAWAGAGSQDHRREGMDNPRFIARREAGFIRRWAGSLTTTKSSQALKSRPPLTGHGHPHT